MNPSLSLSDIKPGERARVRTLLITGAMRRRLLDLGLTFDTPGRMSGVEPFGRSGGYRIRGAVIAIRRADSRQILVY